MAELDGVKLSNEEISDWLDLNRVHNGVYEEEERPKFKMGDMLHYMHDNKIVNSHVQVRITIEYPSHSETRDDGVLLELRRINWTSMDMQDRRVEDADGYYYITRHGIVAECDAYPSKKKLLETL